MTETKLLICGDIMPTASNEAEMADGLYENVVGDVLDVFRTADFRFCNFEGVLTERGTAINKCGPNLRAKPEAGRILSDLGIDLAGLANNHSLDWGREGLTDTMTTLRTLGIPFTGAGYNAADARRPYHVELNGHRISFITVAEHEFTIARDDRAGANPFDPFDTIDDIRSEKAAGYTVIVIYHGGKEHYRMTSPETKRRCRQMAKHGADFIFCQHTHCVCCYEVYEGCHICYGQGNTLFTSSKQFPSECWLTAVIPMVKLFPDGTSAVEYFPITVEDGHIRRAFGETAEAIMKPFYERSALVLDDTYMAKCWREFFLKDGYGLLRETGVLKPDGSIDERHLNVLSAIMNCEIHHESAGSAIRELRLGLHGKLLVDGEE